MNAILLRHLNWRRRPRSLARAHASRLSMQDCAAKARTVLPADLLHAAAVAEEGSDPAGGTGTAAADYLPGGTGDGGSSGSGASGSGAASGSGSGTAEVATAAAAVILVPGSPEVTAAAAAAAAFVAAGRALTEAEHKAFMPTLLRLRQACCHPQVCGWVSPVGRGSHQGKGIGGHTYLSQMPGVFLWLCRWACTHSRQDPISIWVEPSFLILSHPPDHPEP